MKLSQLTFTRFIAAIAIAIYHFRETVFPFTIEGVNNFAQYFNVLVSYFFVLSGFILTVTFKNEVKTKAFYINRFSRIYPLYLFALLLTLFLIFIARTPKDTISFTKVLLSALLAQSWFKNFALTYNFPAWSLSVEAFFYLIFPLVMYLSGKGSLKQLILLTAGFWFIMQGLFILFIANEHFFVIYHPLFHVATFLCGIAAGKYFLKYHAFLNRYTVRLEWMSLLSIFVIIAIVFFRNSFFHNYYTNGLLAPVFVLLIYTVALSSKPFIRIFSYQPLHYLGEISYGIYILQIPVSIMVTGVIDRTIQTSPTITFYIYLITLIITSAITHEMIEKPCRKFIRQFLISRQEVSKI